MTEDEFEVWIDRHQTLFPKLREWLGDQPDATVILTAWATALRGCQASHAADATDRLLRGVDPVVRFNDWADLPSVVIQHCRVMGSGKVERAGDGNYVRGATLKAFRDIVRQPPPSSDPERFREFATFIETMEPGELKETKDRILAALDASEIGAHSAFRLLGMADDQNARISGGNVGRALLGPA